MDCQGIRDELLDVLYGEASEEARLRVSAHQEGCGSCREELAGLRRLRRDLKAWTLPEESVPRRPAWDRRWLPLAAAVLLGLGAGLAAAGVTAASNRDLQARLDRLESQQREQEQRLQAALQTRRAAAPATEDVRAVVQALVSESEARQERRVSEGLAELAARHDAHRRYDLAQVQASLSYLEGKTGLQMARTTELMGHVLLAAQER